MKAELKVAQREKEMAKCAIRDKQVRAEKGKQLWTSNHKVLKGNQEKTQIER